MSKEKQIEEMAKALTKYEKGLCERLPKDKCLLTSAIHAQVSCDYCKIAEFLYHEGYRKQSEVIKEFVEKLYAEFRMYGATDKFNKKMFLTAVDKVAEEMKGV